MNTEEQYRVDLARRVADRLSLPFERVEAMLARNVRLQQICDDYEECCVAARRWGSIESTGHSRLKEFELLAGDLEAEFVRWIAQHMEDSARNTSR